MYMYTVYVQTTGYRYTSVLPHEENLFDDGARSVKTRLKKKEKIRQGATEWNETEAKIEIFINILNK